MFKRKKLFILSLENNMNGTEMSSESNGEMVYTTVMTGIISKGKRKDD